MAVGNFREGNDSGERNEVKEGVEKPKNQILETSEAYDDHFDHKMDDWEKTRESGKENREKADKPDRGGGEEKSGLIDKIKNLFSKREGIDDSRNDGKESSDVSEKKQEDRSSDFCDKLKEGTASMGEQAERAKDFSGREEYMEDREKSEQAKQDHPDLKSWELSSEQLADVKQRQNEMEKGGKADKAAENTDKVGRETKESEDRTPGGDAWDRRFGRVEGEE